MIAGQRGHLNGDRGSFVTDRRAGVAGSFLSRSDDDKLVSVRVGGRHWRPCFSRPVPARAQHSKRRRFPRLRGERVIVVGAPDRYDSLAGQITRLEKASPQSYYVVVVNSSGHG